MIAEPSLFISDLHSHTAYSDCGKDEPCALVEKAIEYGVSLLGITDHNYGIGSRKAEYLREIRALAGRYQDKIRILCGIEISTLPQYYDITDTQEISQYDYCLVEAINEPGSLADGDLFGFCKHLGILCGIAHTNLFAYCAERGYDPAAFFAEMGKYNIFWEMNVNYDSIHGYIEHEYVADFVRDAEKQAIIRDCGVCISVGSDTHRCGEYDDFRLRRMHKFLKEQNIKTVEEVFFSA